VHVHKDVECEDQFGGAFIAFGTLVVGGLLGWQGTVRYQRRRKGNGDIIKYPYWC
jgi:hypothetical protein